MFVIGLTGGIGTGKTTVSEILRELGAEVISADEAGHQVYERGAEGWREVVAAFGDGVLTPDGEVDRSKLGAIVFEDAGALKRLNAIAHPRIRLSIRGRLDELRERGVAVAVVEAALLLEADWSDIVNEIWVTASSEESVIRRVMGRSRLAEDEVRARMRSQMPSGALTGHADAVIENDGSLMDLRAKVVTLWRDRAPRDRKCGPLK